MPAQLPKRHHIGGLFSFRNFGTLSIQQSLPLGENNAVDRGSYLETQWQVTAQIVLLRLRISWPEETSTCELHLRNLDDRMCGFGVSQWFGSAKCMWPRVISCALLFDMAAVAYFTVLKRAAANATLPIFWNSLPALCLNRQPHFRRRQAPQVL